MSDDHKYLTFLVPHLTDWPKVTESSEVILRSQSLTSTSLPERVAALGRLLKLHGLTQENTECARLLLQCHDSAVRGTVFATLIAAYCQGIQIQSVASVEAVLDVVREEPSKLLIPWAMRLRHHLDDATVHAEAVSILEDAGTQKESGMSKLQRAVWWASKDIVDGNKTGAKMF